MKYFIIWLQLTIMLLGLGSVIWMLVSDLPWLVKGPLGAVGFSTAMTFAFACDEYNSKRELRKP